MLSCVGKYLGDHFGWDQGGYQRTVELDSVECSPPAMETVRIDASGSARFREDGRYERRPSWTLILRWKRK